MVLDRAFVQLDSKVHYFAEKKDTSKLGSQDFVFVDIGWDQQRKSSKVIDVKTQSGHF
jgi:hypothetical protein